MNSNEYKVGNYYIIIGSGYGAPPGDIGKMMIAIKEDPTVKYSSQRFRERRGLYRVLADKSQIGELNSPGGWLHPDTVRLATEEEIKTFNLMNEDWSSLDEKEDFSCLNDL